MHLQQHGRRGSVSRAIPKSCMGRGEGEDRPGQAKQAGRAGTRNTPGRTGRQARKAAARSNRQRGLDDDRQVEAIDNDCGSSAMSNHTEAD